MEYPSISVSSGSIDSKEGLPIRYDLYAPIGGGNNHSLPVIIFVHGFKGFKDWGFWLDACEELAYAGFGVLAMNFSLNGIGENKYEFDRLDLFERQTFSSDLDDIGSIIRALQTGQIKDSHAQLDTDKIGIIGHSRGGHTAVTAGVEYEDIRAVVTWASVANYLERWSDGMKKDWESKGYTEIVNGRTGQKMKIGKVVYDDSVENADRVIAMHRVANLRIPSLFIHSRKDESVPYTDSEQLHINCGAREKELRLITTGGHTFGGSHPFEDVDFPEPFQKVLTWTEGWFREYLK